MTDKRERKSVPGYVPLVKVCRGGVVESVHFGAMVVMDDRGRVVAAVGDPDIAVVLRSTAKPVQVLPLIDSGAAERFGFDDRQVAVMIGSHGGEPIHVRAVQSILERIGLGPNALRCGAHPPYYRPAAQRLKARGERPTALHNNCSGKHAAMLALAVHLGAPVASYLDPDHPVQSLIRSRLRVVAGTSRNALKPLVDGCSAPTYALPLQALALAYARLAAGRTADPALARARQAMRRHPDMVAGTGRLCTALMRRGRHGLLAKIGAEGMYGLAWTRRGRGYGLALKIADGDGQRARNSAVLDALRQLSVLSRGDAAGLRQRFVGDVSNVRGLRVGSVEAAFDLA